MKKIEIEHHQLTPNPTKIMVFCYDYPAHKRCTTYGVSFKGTERGNGLDYARVGTWNVKYKNQ